MYPEYNSLDTPPPSSQFRRPWSPDPYNPFPSSRQYAGFDTSRREPSDVSVEALDLADYATTLRSHQPSPRIHTQGTYPSFPLGSTLRPFASRDSTQPPSLASAGGTPSSHSAPRTPTSSRRPYSLPPSLAQHSTASLPRSRNTHQTYQVPIIDPEIDISQFPKWSHNWYKAPLSPSPPYAPDAAYPAPPTDSDFFLNTAKISPFDPSYVHTPSSDPYMHALSAAGSSARDLLPWGSDHLDYGLPLNADVKEERVRMLEREFGKESERGELGPDADGAERNMVGSVDARGRLITVGPKKRVAMRALQITLALGAGIGSIYAAVLIKPPTPPPPQSKLPAYILYILSPITTLALVYLFLIHPCCCGRRTRRAKSDTTSALNMLNSGMMVLPVQGPPDGKKKKGQKKTKAGDSDGVQVNLIIDPGIFGGHDRVNDGDENFDHDDDMHSSFPGSYSQHLSRGAPRRSIFAGLAMEEDWRAARRGLKKVTAFDVGGMVLWGVAFVFILIGKRCPSGGFDGWCDAYNVATAAGCLLCIAFGGSLFLDVKDLHASKVSPRTR